MTAWTDPTFRAASDRFATLAERCRTATDVGDDHVGPDLRDILSRIAAEPEVRFFVDGTRNFGHQASTIVLVKRLLRRTRYTGRVRIVYADYDNPFLGRTADKLAILMPGLDPTWIDTTRLRYGDCADITFVRYDRRGELPERVGFGFTGGADDMSVNYARELNVGCFCRIQPYLWDEGPDRKDDPYYESSRIECIDGRYLYPVDAWPPFRTLVVKAAEAVPSDIPDSTWSWYADEQQFDPALAIRTRNARALYRALARRADCRVWPAYGLHHFREHAAEVALNCVVAACGLQAAAEGPLVLISFTPEKELAGGYELSTALAGDVAQGNLALSTLHDAFRHQFDQAIGGTPGAEQRLAAHIRCLAVRVGDWIGAGGRLTVVPGSADGERDVNAAEAIEEAVRNAAARDVVLVGLGTQAADVFSAFYGIADLPGIIEGQATASQLLSSGVPFLQILREEQIFANGYPAVVPGYDGTAIASRLNECAVRLRDECFGRSAPQRAAGHTVGEPSRSEPDLMAMLDPMAKERRRLGEYVRRIAEYCGKDLHDKFFVGLLALGEVMRVLEAEAGAAPGVTPPEHPDHASPRTAPASSPGPA